MHFTTKVSWFGLILIFRSRGFIYQLPASNTARIDCYIPENTLYSDTGVFSATVCQRQPDFQDGDKVLLIDRRDGLGLGLPGGFLSLKESVEAAAIREVKEETGLDIRLNKILEIYSGRRQGSKIFATNIVYMAAITGDKTTRDSIEGKCRWVLLDEIEHHKIAIDHIEALRLLRKETA